MRPEKPCLLGNLAGTRLEIHKENSGTADSKPKMPGSRGIPESRFNTLNFCPDQERLLYSLLWKKEMKKYLGFFHLKFPLLELDNTKPLVGRTGGSLAGWSAGTGCTQGHPMWPHISCCQQHIPHGLGN